MTRDALIWQGIIGRWANARRTRVYCFPGRVTVRTVPGRGRKRWTVTVESDAIGRASLPRGAAARILRKLRAA